jgi:hypothetical protein
MSRFPNRRWLVIPASEVSNVDFNQVLESSADTLRYSVEEESYTVEAGVYGRPSIYNEVYPEYNHQEILELLATEAWTAPLEYGME